MLLLPGLCCRGRGSRVWVCRFTVGLSIYSQIFWTHDDAKAIASSASNVPQPDAGSYVGLQPSWGR